jgi:WD40 repeat protein
VKVWDATTWQNLLTLRGHAGDVNGVAFSPDGKRIASGGGKIGEAGELKLWDAGTGKLLRNLRGHGREVFRVAFGSDGKYLASASSDQTVKLWDPGTGKELYTLRGHKGFVTSVAFSPDGKLLASGDTDREVKLWDPATGKQVRTFPAHANVIFNLAFSPDGKRLASACGDLTVKLWDVATGQQVLTLPEHQRGARSAAFTADGKQLVTEDAATSKKTTWDIASGKRVAGPVPNTVAGSPISPDGRFIAAAEGEGKRIRIHRLPDGEEPEQTGWRWWIDPAPWWHAEQARQAEDRKDWFAAAFHQGRLAGLEPWDGSRRRKEADLWVKAGKPDRAALAHLQATLLRHPLP